MCALCHLNAFISYLFLLTFDVIGIKLVKWIPVQLAQLMAIEVKCITNWIQFYVILVENPAVETFQMCLGAWNLSYPRHRILRITHWNNKSIIWNSVPLCVPLIWNECIVNVFIFRIWNCRLLRQSIANLSSRRVPADIGCKPGEPLPTPGICDRSAARILFIYLSSRSRLSSEQQIVFVCQCRWRALDKKRGRSRCSRILCAKTQANFRLRIINKVQNKNQLKDAFSRYFVRCCRCAIDASP